MALKGVHVLIPRTCKCVILHYKGNFADVIKYIYKWVLSQIICVGSLSKQKSLYFKEKAEGQNQRENWGCHTATSEEGGHKPINASGFWKLEKRREGLLKSPEGRSVPDRDFIVYNEINFKFLTHRTIKV